MESFITKYKPAALDEHIFNLDVVRIVQMRIATDDLNLILVGGESSGKTTLMNNIIREYYAGALPSDHDETAAPPAAAPPAAVRPNHPTSRQALINSNIMHISSLKDQGTLFCRNDLKIFCQVKSNIIGRKKIVLIDNLDHVNDHNQHIFRSLIDHYNANVHFLCTAVHAPKIIDQIQSRILMLGLRCPTHDDMHKLLGHVVENEGITVTRSAREYVVKTSHGSISRMLNQTEKIMLAELPMTKANMNLLCDGISYATLERYTEHCKAQDYASAIHLIAELHERGFSIIDIFDEYYQYVKFVDESVIQQESKYRIIIVICEYITNFHEFFEHEIELLLFTKLVMNVFLPREHH